MEYCFKELVEANKVSLIRLTQDYTFKPFDCGISDLNDFLFFDSKKYLKHLGYVTYILESENQTIAYFSLANDSLHTSMIEGFWEELPIGEDVTFQELFINCRTFPAVKIGRLAVSKNFQSQQIGKTIIDSLIYSFVNKNKTGCQFITVDALNNPRANKFYQNNKFEYFTNNDISLNTRQMYRCIIPYEAYVKQ